MAQWLGWTCDMGNVCKCCTVWSEDWDWEDGPGGWSADHSYGVGTSAGTSWPRNWNYRGKCTDVFAVNVCVSRQLAKGNCQGCVGVCQVKQISRAIAAFWLQSSNLNLPGLGWWHRPGAMLTGDMMPSKKFLLAVETCPCIVSDLHLVAANANFICSVKIYFIL